MDRAGFAAWVSAVGGVATRAELAAAGVSSGTIARRIRDGEWQRPFPAVFLLFSGVPTWEQRLACVQKWVAGRGVFSHQTAAFLHGLRREPPSMLEVTVPLAVGLRSTARCRVRRTSGVLTKTGNPSRTSLVQTVVDLVGAAATEAEVLEILIAAMQKRVNPVDVERGLVGESRVRHRGFATRVLAVAAEGVESHLELEHRRRVERAHGLPVAVRQKRQVIRGRWVRADCVYERFRVRVELDGELAHPGRPTDADVMRDNDARLAFDEITLRYRWAQVWNTPCLVAAQQAAALRRRGWKGKLKKCSPDCTAAEIAVSYPG